MPKDDPSDTPKLAWLKFEVVSALHVRLTLWLKNKIVTLHELHFGPAGPRKAFIFIGEIPIRQ